MIRFTFYPSWLWHGRPDDGAQYRRYFTWEVLNNRRGCGDFADADGSLVVMGGVLVRTAGAVAVG